VHCTVIETRCTIFRVTISLRERSESIIHLGGAQIRNNFFFESGRLPKSRFLASFGC
jgi:hypothetical protein